MEEKLEKLAIFLETHTYPEIMGYLSKLKKTNSFEYMLFLTMVYTQELLIRINRHKVSLARIIEKNASSAVMPEDRSRIVLLLSELSKYDFEKAKKIFLSEFGPNLPLLPSYRSSTKEYDWAFLSKKAYQIKRGLYNHSYLSVKDTVNKIMSYYKIYGNYDLEQLKNTEQLAVVIITKLNNNKLLTPSSPQAKEIIELLTKFYKLTNRINIDIEKIDQGEDFYTEKEYVLNLHYVIKTRLALIDKKLSPQNFDLAEKIVFQELGKIKFFDLLSYEEIQRFGKKL